MPTVMETMDKLTEEKKSFVGNELSLNSFRATNFSDFSDSHIVIGPSQGASPYVAQTEGMCEIVETDKEKLLTLVRSLNDAQFEEIAKKLDKIHPGTLTTYNRPENQTDEFRATELGNFLKAYPYITAHAKDGEIPTTEKQKACAAIMDIITQTAAEKIWLPGQEAEKAAALKNQLLTEVDPKEVAKYFGVKTYYSMTPESLLYDHVKRLNLEPTLDSPEGKIFDRNCRFVENLLSKLAATPENDPGRYEIVSTPKDLPAADVSYKDSVAGPRLSQDAEIIRDMIIMASVTAMKLENEPGFDHPWTKGLGNGDPRYLEAMVKILDIEMRNLYLQQNKEIQELKTQLQDVTETKQQLTEQLQGIQHELQDIQQQRERLEQEKAAISPFAPQEERELKLKELDQAIQALDQKAQALEEQAKGVEEKLQEVDQTIKEYNDKIEKAENQKQELEKAPPRLQFSGVDGELVITVSTPHGQISVTAKEGVIMGPTAGVSLPEAGTYVDVAFKVQGREDNQNDKEFIEKCNAERDQAIAQYEQAHPESIPEFIPDGPDTTGPAQSPFQDAAPEGPNIGGGDQITTTTITETSEEREI